MLVVIAVLKTHYIVWLRPKKTSFYYISLPYLRAYCYVQSISFPHRISGLSRSVNETCGARIINVHIIYKYIFEGYTQGRVIHEWWARKRPTIRLGTNGTNLWIPLTTQSTSIGTYLLKNSCIIKRLYYTNTKKYALMTEPPRRHSAFRVEPNSWLSSRTVRRGHHDTKQPVEAKREEGPDERRRTLYLRWIVSRVNFYENSSELSRPVRCVVTINLKKFNTEDLSLSVACAKRETGVTASTISLTLSGSLEFQSAGTPVTWLPPPGRGSQIIVIVVLRR